MSEPLNGINDGLVKFDASIEGFKNLIYEAVKDSERLEWLIKNVNVVGGIEGKGFYIIDRNKRAFDYDHAFKTPREAIDDAMRRERE